MVYLNGLEYRLQWSIHFGLAILQSWSTKDWRMSQIDVANIQKDFNYSGLGERGIFI